jgi:hypothetical protein
MKIQRKGLVFVKIIKLNELCNRLRRNFEVIDKYFHFSHLIVTSGGYAK